MRGESEVGSQRSTIKDSNKTLEPQGAGLGVRELSQSGEINFHVALCPQIELTPEKPDCPHVAVTEMGCCLMP